MKTKEIAGAIGAGVVAMAVVAVMLIAPKVSGLGEFGSVDNAVNGRLAEVERCLDGETDGCAGHVLKLREALAS